MFFSVKGFSQDYGQNRFSEEQNSTFNNEESKEGEQLASSPGGPGEPHLPINDYIPVLMLVALVGIVVTVKSAQKLNHR